MSARVTVSRAVFVGKTEADQAQVCRLLKVGLDLPEPGLDRVEVGPVSRKAPEL